MLAKVNPSRSLSFSPFPLTATGGAEQALRVHQDPGAASQGELQGEEGEEPGGRDNGAPCHPHPRVPQCHLDLAGLPHGH